jgi:hypothetical protein
MADGAYGEYAYGDGEAVASATSTQISGALGSGPVGSQPAGATGNPIFNPNTGPAASAPLGASPVAANNIVASTIYQNGTGSASGTSIVVGSSASLLASQAQQELRLLAPLAYQRHRALVSRLEQVAFYRKAVVQGMQMRLARRPQVPLALRQDRVMARQAGHPRPPAT